MVKYTPGPWEAIADDNKHVWYVVAPSDTVVGTSALLSEADARLIAAAPEMRVMLEQVLMNYGQPGSRAPEIALAEYNHAKGIRALLARIDGEGA